ncbi:MAG: transcriptional regulator [Nitrospirae bacterium]|uniref:Putative regulatory protein, FmdB family n=1 Tax=Leptospirillum ferrodiazotrophum TaxID=412449 RepID=C6I0B3_9BACT|nr:MAG: putative regulatory protein, FmdB family [Leptospirillum ferrodiazotrophum]MCL5954201.1 transcriptional regulator [Nitrospirota bacterium]
MPLYEYSCEKCHSVVEKIQKFSDPPLTVCEKCGGPLVRLMGKPALQFKGTGFYITDYVKKGGGESEGKSKGTESTSIEGASASSTAAASASSSPAPAAPAASSPSPGAASNA